MSRIKQKKLNFTKTQTIALSFLLIILIGTGLLMLPISSLDGTWTDPLTAMFTAISTSCVTGLVVVDTFSHWSIFGRCVLLVLIQIGGLGVITLAVLFAVFFKRNITLKSRNLLQESINSMQIGGVLRLIRKVLWGTLLFEGCGALLLMIYFIPRLGFWSGVGYGIFHSISAFCNAGFDLMGYVEPYNSFCSAVDSVLVNVTLMLLITIGGIGFLIWDDILDKKLKIRKYQIHTKIVLATSLILVLGGAVLFFIFEYNGLFAGMSFGEKILAAFFSSVTTRTAGFNTVDTAGLSNSSMVVNDVLMLIGGSPGSTAGGVKTSTIAVIMVSLFTTLRSKKGANVFGRCISDETVKKAQAIFMLDLTLAIAAMMLICAIQPGLSARDVVFEVISAIGTVGMSTGVTRELGTGARIIIMLLMYLGRIGSMTFALSFSEGKLTPKVQYPQVDIPVG